MPYCVHCGVELDNGVKKCPLCNTAVIDPNIDSTNVKNRYMYPRKDYISPDKLTNRFLIGIVSLFTALPAAIVLICDLLVNSAIGWSGYVIGALMILYIPTITQIYLRKRTGDYKYLIHIFEVLALTLAYIYCICINSGGRWFFRIAVPIEIALFLFIIVIMLMKKNLGVKSLVIIAVINIGAGIICLVIEAVLNIHMLGYARFAWSFYPFITCCILGFILLLIDRNVYVKQKISRKFFR